MVVTIEAFSVSWIRCRVSEPGGIFPPAVRDVAHEFLPFRGWRWVAPKSSPTSVRWGLEVSFFKFSECAAVAEVRSSAAVCAHTPSKCWLWQLEYFMRLVLGAVSAAICVLSLLSILGMVAARWIPDGFRASEENPEISSFLLPVGTAMGSLVAFCFIRSRGRTPRTRSSADGSRDSRT